MESSQIFDFLPRNPGTGRLTVIVDEDLGFLSSPSSSESVDASSLSDLDDDATSSTSVACTTGGCSSPLSEMSDLPVRRGLSRHYKGKSQSFTSLANARCLQDLVKPTRRMPPSKPTIRPCRSYAAGLDGHHHHANNNNPHSPKADIAKRPVRNTTFRPPMHPHSAGNLSGQPHPMLFA